MALVMDPEDIEKLHEAALGLYVSGRYAEARRAWEAILVSAPEEERAVEGIRMVRVLAGEWPVAATESAPAHDGPIDEELQRIEGMLAEARYGDALLAAQHAAESQRGHKAARRLAARALELFEAAPYIDVELNEAKKASAEGRSDDARAACEKILSLDPAHAAARELLARAGGAPARSAPSAAAKPMPVAAAKPAAPPAPRPAASPQPPPAASPKVAPAPAPSAMQAPAPGAFFDLTDADLLDGPVPDITPLGKPVPASAASPAPGSSGSSHEDTIFDETAGGPSSPRTKDAISGLTAAPESGNRSLFEMPDEDVPTIKTSFSELEAEIDESQAPADGEVDFDIPPEGEAPGFDAPVSASVPPAASFSAPAPAPAVEPAADFSFDEEDFALPADAAPVAGSSSASPEARIAALLEESRASLRAGRYPEAIEAAARAFAIDPDAQGAQQLIDEARTRQDEADREAEETLYTARDKMNTGDLAAAEQAYSAVLKIHPAHREALDGLDQIARRRNESEIQGKPIGKSSPAAQAKPSKPAVPETPEPAWPTEPLTPRSSAPKSASAEAPVRPSSSVTPVAAAAATSKKKSPSKMGRKLLVLAAAFGGLAVLVVGGLFAMSFVFGGKTRPVEKAVLTPPRERKPKGEKPAPSKAPATEKPRQDPAQFAAGVERTLPEARRLVSEGKLEAARVVLADMVRAAPDNIAAVDALKDVQSKIVERDRVAESMDQIRHAFKQERYEDALRMLYRLPPDMQRGDIERYKTNAWYDNGINYLLGGNTAEAVHCFEEALSLDPHDQQAQRLKAYAKTYTDREKDSAFLTFVDSLEKRPMDAR